MARRIAIIGNGIAGITAARHLRKRGDDEIVVISDESDHFFARTALMYVYMGHMRYEDVKPYDDAFWARNRIGLVRGRVERVVPTERRLHLAGGGTIEWDLLLLATGSKSNSFDWPGRELPGVQGLYSLQDLARMQADTVGVSRAVVVGGGLIGIEVAEMLRSRGIDVTFLVREAAWMDFVFPAEESAMIARHVREHGVDLRLGTELDHLLPGPDGRVRAAVTRSGEVIPCGFVALTVGVVPNIGFLSGSGIECGHGVLVDEQLRSSVAGVYAAGDCAELRRPRPGRRAIEPVWYVGRAMGEAVARTLAGDATGYEQGLWFNSAKFFDLEWQLYGDVPPLPPEGHDTLFWQDAAGCKSIRVNHRQDDGAVTGFNLVGVRYRQEICERWIAARRPIQAVLEELGAANFDPEFHRQHEVEVVAAWNRTHPAESVRLRRRRGLWERRPSGSAA